MTAVLTRPLQARENVRDDLFDEIFVQQTGFCNLSSELQFMRSFSSLNYSLSVNVT